jgi:hypothetical protein
VYGYGAGAGTGGVGDTSARGEGGGGGAVRTVRVGAIEVSKQQTRFAPITDRKKITGALSSGVKSKAANGGHFKTGQREWPGTRLFYSVAS